MRANPRGSPRRSFRWPGSTFSKLYELSTDTGVSVNHVAKVAADWGLVFLNSLDAHARNRLLGVKGTKPLTLQEMNEFKQRTQDILAVKAGTLRRDTVLGIRVPRRTRVLMLEKKRKTGLTLTEQIRRGELITEPVPS